MAEVFRPRAESVGAAREFTRRVLAGVGLDVDDIVLCVSELVANAVQHGSAPGRRFRLNIEIDDHRVRVECQDTVRRRARLRTPSIEDAGGRGLLLVQALTSRWGVDPRPPGKVVWFEIDRSPDEETERDRAEGKRQSPPRRQGTPPLHA
ncbi:ATP-binding protein [Streptomyces cyanogenus]|uniref:ATP-binding protein n=1 Tax=Streptomyces cyanogenus TaxID=80860 RepID=UPI001AA148EA|nr:ATP-binding protein [Streptomyces cyanogenus]